MKKELLLLNKQSKNIKTLSSDNNLTHPFLSYYSLIDVLHDKCEDKLEYFSFRMYNRVRRGAMNFVGTGLNWLFGTVDANDKANYDKIIENLENNQVELNKEFMSSYTLNRIMNDKLNQTFHVISNNQLSISSLSKNNSKAIDRLSIENDFQLLINRYQLLLTTLDEITTSTSFCRNHQLHQSIIPSNALISQMKNLDTSVRSQLPFPLTIDYIFAYEEILSIDCTYKNGILYYFVKIPIYSTTPYMLKRLRPIPSIVQSIPLTIQPTYETILQNQKEIIPAVNCKWTTPVLCDKIPPHYDVSCEEDILIHQNSRKCSHISEPLFNSLELLENTNQFIMYGAPNNSFVKICNDSIPKEISLTGIWLIQPNNCQIKYKGHFMDYKYDPNKTDYLPFPGSLQLTHLLNVSLNLQEVEFTVPEEPIQLKTLSFLHSEMTFEYWIVCCVLTGSLLLGYYFLRCHYQLKRNPAHPDTIELVKPPKIIGIPISAK